MIDPTKRFSGRAEDYANFRPSYPAECIRFLQSRFNVIPGALVADIGSGTGILTALLLELGCEVAAIEPNDQMRAMAEKRLRSRPGFMSIRGTGERTNLRAGSVDLITVAQAFHWMDASKAREEFSRILKPHGSIAIIWNVHTLQTAFDKAYEDLKIKYGKDYLAIRKSHEPDLSGFFAPKKYDVTRFAHHKVLDSQGMTGLIHSSSFMPTPADACYPGMMEEADDFFRQFQEGGLIRINYETQVHFGVS